MVMVFDLLCKCSQMAAAAGVFRKPERGGHRSLFLVPSAWPGMAGTSGGWSDISPSMWLPWASPHGFIVDRVSDRGNENGKEYFITV